MTLRLPELAIAGVLAGGFAAAGEALIGRARSIVSWNDSFLAGLGVCTALLFPLSVLAPRSALTIVLVILGAAILFAVGRRFGTAPPAANIPRPLPEPRDALSLTCILAVALMIACFAVLNLRFPFSWDGFQIWATKAMSMHHEGGLRPRMFPDADYEGRVVGYPNAVPLYEALLSVLRGGFAFEAVKPIFLVFYLSLSIAFLGLARAILPERGALLALALLLAMPGISRIHNLGGYADMPLAAAVTAAAGACARWRPDARARRAAPWLIGSLALIKNEGVLLAGVFAVLIVAFLAADGAAGLRADGKRLVRGGAIVASLCLAQALYVRWTNNPDTTYAPIDWAHLSQAPRALPPIFGLCIRELLDADYWIFLWAAFPIAAIVVAARGSRLERVLAAGCVLVLGGEAAIYLFTTWDVPTHIQSSYTRLAEHVAPIAMVVLVAGARRGLILTGARRGIDAKENRSGTLADQQLEVARQKP